MAGTSYQHRDGSIAVHFHATQGGWTWMSLRLQQPGTTETDVDDEWDTVCEHTADTEIRRFKWRMSSAYCPFRNLIAWLEAIACGVQRCEWLWEGEGPDYSILWNSNQLVFTINCEELFRVHLSRDQILRAFYCSFRRFVASKRYRLAEWENRLSIDVLLEKIHGALTLEELRGQLLMYDFTALERALLPVTAVVVADEFFEPRDQFRPATEGEESILGGSEYCRHLIHPLVPAEWDSWPVERRRAELDRIFSSRFGGWGGTPLRTIRSPLVEEFLAKEANGDHGSPQHLGDNCVR